MTTNTESISFTRHKVNYIREKIINLQDALFEIRKKCQHKNTIDEYGEINQMIIGKRCLDCDEYIP